MYLNPKENPELGKVLDGYNGIMERWNAINRELHAFETPLLYSPKIKRKLIGLVKRFGHLQEEWLQHQRIAYKFIRNPVFRFPEDADNRLGFHWYHSILMDTVNRVRFNMALLGTNFNTRMGEVYHARDFNIAIGSFLLSFIGLIVALAK